MGLYVERRLVVLRGEIWWASLPEPRGSGPSFRRPVVIVQSDPFNESLIGTVIVAVITSNLRLASAPGNVSLENRESGLPKDSVINISQILTVDKSFLTEQVSTLPDQVMIRLSAGLRLVLGL